MNDELSPSTATPPTEGSPTGETPRRSLMTFLPAAVFGAIALLFLVALLKPGEPSDLPSEFIGKPAPAITLPPLPGISDNGAPVPGITPADFKRGTPVIVNFWQSTCLPCIGEHPLLILLHEKTGLPVLGVNYQDQAAGARRFLNRYGNPFAAVGVDDSGRAAIDWGVYGMPETFILNGKGEIVYKHIGALSEEAIEAKILPAIAKAR